MADSLLLPLGLCVVVTQKPGALSLTLMVTSVVTVFNHVICYAKSGSITVGNVNRILFWREALSCRIADNKRTSLTEKLLRCFCLGRMLKLKDSIVSYLCGRETFAHRCGQRKAKGSSHHY